MATDDALDRLNASERELLLLLGRGHTAKSIAALKNLTELAVNERFRAARRKTGIGSSREIARLLVAQENRHDFIGLAEPVAAASDPPRPDAPRRASPQRWRTPMAAAVLVAAALLAQQTSVSSTADRPIPAAAAAMFTPFEPSPDLVALRAEIATGPADPAWSRRTEAALAGAYHAVLDSTDTVEALNVTCNASLCEVLGVSQEGLTEAQINTLTQAIQGRAVNETVKMMNLDNIVQGFHSTSGNATAEVTATMVFAAYWRRND